MYSDCVSESRLAAPPGDGVMGWPTEGGACVCGLYSEALAFGGLCKCAWCTVRMSKPEFVPSCGVV